MVVHGNSHKGFYLPSFEYNYKIKIAYYVGLIRNFLPDRTNSFKTKLISNSKEPIYAAFFQSEGILIKLKDSVLTKESALSLHPHALSSLDSTVKFYNKINSIKSYLDDSTIETVEKIVDNYYEVESYIRNIAYSNTALDKKDEVINEIASEFSKQILNSFDEV